MTLPFTYYYASENLIAPKGGASNLLPVALGPVPGQNTHISKRRQTLMSTLACFT